MVNDRIRQKVFFIAQFEFKASFCAFVLHCTTYKHIIALVWCLTVILHVNITCVWVRKINFWRTWPRDNGAAVVQSGCLQSFLVRTCVICKFRAVFRTPRSKCKLWWKSLPKLTLAHKVCRRDYRVNSMENRKQEQTLLKRSAAGFDWQSFDIYSSTKFQGCTQCQKDFKGQIWSKKSYRTKKIWNEKARAPPNYVGRIRPNFKFEIVWGVKKAIKNAKLQKCSIYRFSPLSEK